MEATLAFINRWTDKCDVYRHIKPPYDLAITLTGTYPKEAKTEKDTCTPVFTAVLFKIARTWKLPRCPSIDEWIKKLWYRYTMEYHSAKKKEHIWIHSNEVDKTRVHYTKWSKSEREI